jgi:hypothetical protein
MFSFLAVRVLPGYGSWWQAEKSSFARMLPEDMGRIQTLLLSEYCM